MLFLLLLAQPISTQLQRRSPATHLNRAPVTILYLGLSFPSLPLPWFRVGMLCVCGGGFCVVGGVCTRVCVCPTGPWTAKGSEQVCFVPKCLACAWHMGATWEVVGHLLGGRSTSSHHSGAPAENACCVTPRHARWWGEAP